MVQETYNYTGSKETVNLTGVDELTVEEMYAGSAGNRFGGGNAWAGGYVGGYTFDVSGTDTLGIWVGEHGGSTEGDGAGGWGKNNGGDGGVDGFEFYYGAGGGGSTELWIDGGATMLAAADGGGGDCITFDSTNGLDQDGGGGGGGRGGLGGDGRYNDGEDGQGTGYGGDGGGEGLEDTDQNGFGEVGGQEVNSGLVITSGTTTTGGGAGGTTNGDDTSPSNGKVVIEYIEPNNPPAFTAGSESPANGTSDVSLVPTLSIDVTDADGDTMDVTFYDASNDSQIGSTQTGVADGGTASVTWSGRDWNTTYSWYAVADDGSATTTSSTFSFTTTDGVPQNVQITDDTVGGELTIDWDPVSDATGYYVYRAEASGSAKSDYTQIVDVSNPPYVDQNLEDGERYYYRVSAYN